MKVMGLLNIRLFITALGFFGLLSLVSVPVNAMRTERIASVVNDDAISFSDVNDRLRLIITSSGLSDTPDVREKLMPQVLTSLIDEQLKLQEAHRLEINISSDEIHKAFASIAGQNQMEPEKFKEVLRGSGINLRTMERQIEAQIAWQKIVQSLLNRKVKVSDADIDAVLERFRNSEGKTEYLLAEIYLPIAELDQEQDVRNLAHKLAAQAQEKAGSFFKIAQQFSKAAGSSQGGDIGWVQEGYLSEELDRVIVSLEKNQISRAARSLSGYHIFFVRDKRVITEENLPSREQVGQSLANERLDRLQRRHIMDLKAAAFIEKRV